MSNLLTSCDAFALRGDPWITNREREKAYENFSNDPAPVVTNYTKAMKQYRSKDEAAVGKISTLRASRLRRRPITETERIAYDKAATRLYLLNRRLLGI